MTRRACWAPMLAALSFGLTACQDASRLGVVNGCATEIEARGSSESSFDGMHWRRIERGKGMGVADAPDSAVKFYVAIRGVGDSGEGETTVRSAADVTQVSRKDAGYDVEVTISGDLCPGT